MEKTILEIQEVVDRKQAASKFKEGELYWDVTVIDSRTGRKGRTFGDWAKDWKIGDKVDVMWEKSSFVNSQGTSVDTWKLKDPNVKPKGNWGGNKSNTKADAMLIAATLLSPFFFKAEKINFEQLDTLTEQLEAKLITPLATAPVTQPVQTQVQQAVPVAQAEPAKIISEENTMSTASEKFEEDPNIPF
jgi:hypothetical protein